MIITKELRRFIEVDNHESVKIGDLAKPKFTKEINQNAAVQEAVGELTLREGEEGEEGTLRSFIDTADVEASRRGPPLVDEDWHALCEASYKGVEGAEWENLCCKFVEMNQEVDVRHPSESSVAKRRRQRER